MQLISQQVGLQTATRTNVQKLMADYSLEQLNTIPKGFSNNMIWNYGHMIVTHQLLTYGLSGLPLNVDAEIIAKYRKGTKPESKVDEKEYRYLKEKFGILPRQFVEDFKKGVFTEYKIYETSYGVGLSSVHEGLTFNNMHEAMHFGTLLSLRKFV